MDSSRLEWLSATDAARAIAEGAVSSEQLVEACLARIRAAEPEVQAWHFLDPEHALAQARAREAWLAGWDNAPVTDSAPRPVEVQGRLPAALAGV